LKIIVLAVAADEVRHTAGGRCVHGIAAVVVVAIVREARVEVLVCCGTRLAGTTAATTVV
jgi:hypothetical protein